MSQVRDKLIVDATLVYASVQKPNQTANAYTVDLIPLTKADEDKLLAAGLSPATDRAGVPKSHSDMGFTGSVFKAKRGLTKKDGTPKTPPLVTDSQNNPISDFLGNGTKARVLLNVYSYNFLGKKGVAADLNTVQVLELVPFQQGLAPVEGGYVARTSSGTDIDVDPASLIT